MDAPVDMLGREIKVGDTIAYAVTIGRSACQAVYEVVEIKSRQHFLGGVIPTLRAKQTHVSYGRVNEKVVTLAMPERSLLIGRPDAR